MLHNTATNVYQALKTSRFIQLIILGLTLRVLLMPFFGHNDILSEARRVYFWAENGIYIDAISRNATSLFQVFFFKLFGWIIPNKDLLFSHANMMNTTATPTDYFTFVTSEFAHRAIFIIKIPFLVADLVVAWCVYAYFNKDSNGLRAAAFWLFNPITLFAIYIFGRFESIPVMYLALSLLAFKHKRIVLAAICIGLAVNAREIFIFLGPVFIALMLSPSANHLSWLKRLSASGIVLLALMLATQVITITSGASDTTAFGNEISSIASESRVDFLFQFIVGSWLIFPMAVFIVLLYAWNSKGELSNKALYLFSAIFIAFFVTSAHTAHYTSWLVIFPILFIGYNKACIKPFIMLCIAWFFYHASITDRGVFTAWLASPWSMNNSGLPMFPWIYDASGMDKTLPLLQFARLWKTFFCAAALYLFTQMSWVYFKQLKDDCRSEGSHAL